MSVVLAGGCACGAVRYERASEPLVCGHCQCRACQRASGTGHGSHIMVAMEALTVRGEVTYWESPADSGNIVGRGFCPICGSPVLSRNSGFPDHMFLRVASLDDPAKFVPTLVVFTGTAQPWDRIDPELTSFEAQPDAIPGT